MDVRELVWAVRGAPLVLRIQEFLGWLGDQRRLSRIPLPAPQGHRRYTYVSLGSWVRVRDESRRRSVPSLGEEAALLDLLVTARMLEVVVAWLVDQLADGTYSYDRKTGSWQEKK